jgi:hypothetical protein
LSAITTIFPTKHQKSLYLCNHSVEGIFIVLPDNRFIEFQAEGDEHYGDRENTIASAENSGLNIAPEIEYKSPIANKGYH